MAIFGRNKEKNETKKQKKAENYLKKHNLNNLESDINHQVNRIASDMSGAELTKIAMGLTFSDTEEQAKVGYASAQVEQNWIIIKQQDEIIKQLKKLNEK